MIENLVQESTFLTLIFQARCASSRIQLFGGHIMRLKDHVSSQIKSISAPFVPQLSFYDHDDIKDEIFEKL